jgi:chromosome segregation ATPase
VTQRQRNLEEQRAEVETRRAILEEKILSAGTTALPEWSHELARLESRLRAIDAELAPAGDPRQAAYQRAVDLLGQWVGELKTRMDRLEQKLDSWIEREESERHERQEAMDKRLDTIAAQLGELRVWGIGCAVVLLLLFAFDVALRVLAR